MQPATPEPVGTPVYVWSTTPEKAVAAVASDPRRCPRYSSRDAAYAARLSGADGFPGEELWIVQEAGE